MGSGCRKFSISCWAKRSICGRFRKSKRVVKRRKEGAIRFSRSDIPRKRPQTFAIFGQVGDSLCGWHPAGCRSASLLRSGRSRPLSLRSMPKIARPDLRSPGADQAGQPEDLAALQAKADLFERRPAGSGLPPGSIPRRSRSRPRSPYRLVIWRPTIMATRSFSVTSSTCRLPM